MMPSDDDGEGGDSLTRNAFSVVRYSWKLILLPQEIATSVRRDLRKSEPVLMPAFLARLKPAAKTQRMSQGGRQDSGVPLSLQALHLGRAGICGPEDAGSARTRGARF